MVASSNSSITSSRGDSRRSVSRRSDSRRSVSAWSFGLIAGFIVAAGATARFFAATGLPDTPDALRLIRSLARFDLLEFSPHFPGYPLAVASARTLADLAGTPLGSGLSWSWLQVGASLLLAPLAALLCLPKEAPRARAGVIALLAVHPFLALESVRVGTDFLALPGIYASLLLLRDRDGSGRGGVLLGLILGFRPSLFPWLLALLGAPRKRSAFVGAVVGLLAWILPTAAIVGSETWIAEGVRFVEGHFTTWGGSVGSAGAAESSRLAAMLQRWGIEPLAPAFLPILLRMTLVGGALLLIVSQLLLLSRGLSTSQLGARGAIGRTRFGPRSLGPLGWGITGYAGWILFAQNPEHARHVIPLAPLALASLVGVAAREGRDVRGGALAIVLAAILAPSTIGLLADYRASTPPPLEAARRLAIDPRFDPLLDRIYVADDRPYFISIGPHWSIGTVFSKDELERDLISLPISPRRVWISSQVRGRPAPPPPLGEAANDSAIIARRDPSLSPYAAELRIELRIEREPR